jgi:flagellar FliJ protein
MSTPSAINTLISLASIEADDAARRLGNAIRIGEESEHKLALLHQYRDEYAARFQAGMAAGLTAPGYRNFQLFLDKLDQAIAGQQQIVRDAARRVGEERKGWQESERKRKSYGTLADRAEQKEQKMELKRDQKLTDEHAARQAFYKR